METNTTQNMTATIFSSKPKTIQPLFTVLQKLDLAEQHLVLQLQSLASKKQLAQTTTRVLEYRAEGRHLFGELRRLSRRIYGPSPGSTAGMRARARLGRISRRQAWWNVLWESHLEGYERMLECEQELGMLLESVRMLKEEALSEEMERLVVTETRY